MHQPKVNGSWRFRSCSHGTDSGSLAVQPWIPTGLATLRTVAGRLEGELPLPGGRPLTCQGQVTPASAPEPPTPGLPPGLELLASGTDAVGHEVRYELRGFFEPNQDPIVGMVRRRAGGDVPGQGPGTVGPFLLTRS